MTTAHRFLPPAFWYATRRGMMGMLAHPGVQALSVGTMSVCMLLLWAVLLVWKNAEAVRRDFGLDVPLTVYLTSPSLEGLGAGEGPSAPEGLALADRLRRVRGVAEVDHVSSAEALVRLRETLGEGVAAPRDPLLGLEQSALPDTLEVKLVHGVSESFADELASALEKRPEVESVARLGRWVARGNAFAETLEELVVGVAVCVALACLAIVWATIRLGLFSRREELHILALVGGTSFFVRGPFLFEGLLQGVLASVVSVTLLDAGFDALLPFLEEGFSLLLVRGALGFFEPWQLALGVALGGLVGLLGSALALGRHVDP